MKTLTSICQLLAKKLLITLLLLFLLIGCTSKAEREFREADGKMVTVDTTFPIQKENREAKVLESGTYKIEYDANYKENIWFKSLNTGDIMLMDFTEYTYVVDNKILRPPTPADFAKAEQEKEARSKIVEARSVDLGSFVLVAGEEYQGDTIMKVIDANAPKAKFNSDQTINFRFGDKYYYVGTQKVTFDYPAVYKITFIKYKGLPWKQSDY
jgi:hypothetical protein